MSTTISRRLALGVGAASVAIVGVAGLASSALFTSQDTSTGNSFTTGTVAINTGAGTAVFTVANMAPGDVNYGKVGAGFGNSERRHIVYLKPLTRLVKRHVLQLNMP